jgi:fused signal recognition particle receptor
MSDEAEKKSGFFSRLFKRDRRAETEETEPGGAGIAPAEPVEAEEAADVAVAEQWEEAPQDAAEDEAASLRLQEGLKKTRKGFIRNLDEIFLGKKQLDDRMVVRLEEVLVTADIGVKTAYQLLDTVQQRIKRREIDDPSKVMGHLKAVIAEMLGGVEAPLRIGYGSEPFVVMVVGVNGSGKTTTIAKMAARHAAAGRKVFMVAADTFRAAAVEQLSIWGERVGCTVIKGKEKADPSSIVFEAMERAVAEDAEIVLVDTAGRLHTRVPLMDELKKVRRTVSKKMSSAPHETLLVIDASMGQNAILQATTFNEAVPVTGIALTKLDGTSKGGVLVGISNELKIPVRYIGIGEKMDDLRDFNARDFTEALFAANDAGNGD